MAGRGWRGTRGRRGAVSRAVSVVQLRRGRSRRPPAFWAGLAAGAAGTTALNAITYLDMAARRRPGSSTPEESVRRLADAVGLKELAVSEAEPAANRRTGLVPPQPRGNLLQDAVHVLPERWNAAGRDWRKGQRWEADIERRRAGLRRWIERNWPDVGPRNRRVGEWDRELRWNAGSLH